MNNLNINHTIEVMKCGIPRKINFIRRFIHSEYGNNIRYRLRYSRKDNAYHDDTILLVKLTDKKYLYVDIV